MGHKTKLEPRTLVMIDRETGEEIILGNMPELEMDVNLVPPAVDGIPFRLEYTVALTKKSQRKLKRFLHRMKIKAALMLLFNK